MSAEVAVVVVNHGTPGDTVDCLGALRRYVAPGAAEVVVVNTIPEGAYAARDGADGVRVVQMDRNRGYGAAVNRGMAETTAPLLLPMNADVLFLEGALERMVTRMKAEAEVGVLVPRLVTPAGELQYNARNYYSAFTILCRRTPLGRVCRGTVARHLLTDRDHESAFPVDWGLGAALLARRALAEGGRLFDERFFLYFEDVDLCARAWARGYRVEYYPPATLVHAHRRQSARRPWGREGRSHLASLWRFWRKHGTLRPRGAAPGESGP